MAMDISIGKAGGCGLCAYFAFEGEIPKAAGGDDEIIRKAIKAKEFECKEGTQLLIRKKGGKSLIVGLGKKDEFKADALRAAAGRASAIARDGGEKNIGFAYSEVAEKACGKAADFAACITEGSLLALYRFDKYKSQEKGSPKKELTKIVIEAKDADAAKRGIAYARAACEGANIARDIANECGIDASPMRIAAKAAKMARQRHISCKCLSAAECRKLGMGSYLSVAAGSETAPAFLVFQYRPRGAKKTVCLIGKGVTFDSGGITLKPGRDMEKMKHDKCGAAAVIGLMMSAPKLGLKANIVGITPLVENMPSGSATKPGDIVKAMNGKSIEVINTDAEGRLILADALVYAQRFKPDATIDLATLTGACVVALGSHAAGLLGNDAKLCGKIKAAGEATGERVWELPLWKEYGDAMKGEFADLKNSSGDGEAGTITAASFLSNFASAKAWAHIDIAGTAYTYKPRKYYLQNGATGFGVRLLAKLLLDF